MLQRICIEFSDEALDTIYKKYTNPVEFVQASINLGLSRISNYSHLYDIDCEKITPKTQRDRAKAIRDIIRWGAGAQVILRTSVRRYTSPAQCGCLYRKNNIVTHIYN